MFTTDKNYPAAERKGLENALSYITNQENNLDFKGRCIFVDGYMEIKWSDDENHLVERIVNIPRCKLTEKFFA